jgi:Uma2 family endonuclease
MLTVTGYLRTSYEPHCEYLDGDLRPKQPKDDAGSSLLAALVVALAAQDRRLGLRVRPSRHIRISPTRYRVPDVAVFLEVDKQVAATTAPLLTVEIVSPEDTSSGLLEAVHDHLAMGAETVIVADPHARAVFLATARQPLHQLTPPLKIQIEVPNRGTLDIDFDQVFADMD